MRRLVPMVRGLLALALLFVALQPARADFEVTDSKGRRIKLKDKALSLSSVTWGEFFKGSGKILFGQKGPPKIESLPVNGDRFYRVFLGQ